MTSEIQRQLKDGLIRLNVASRKTLVADQEMLELEEETDLLYKGAPTELFNDEIRELLAERKSIRRQRCALWLRLILADYEF